MSMLILINNRCSNEQRQGNSIFTFNPSDTRYSIDPTILTKIEEGALKIQIFGT